MPGVIASVACPDPSTGDMFTFLKLEVNIKPSVIVVAKKFDDARIHTRSKFLLMNMESLPKELRPETIAAITTRMDTI